MTSNVFASLLQGVRILDCTRNIAGPVSTMLAAEMGATVIKIEPPGGDEMRQWPPFIDGESAYFISCNRGKRSIVLDFKTDEGRALFGRLLATADILIENYRPGTLEKLGLGWQAQRAAHPRLIWISVSGYGRSGPRAEAPAYDSMIQAFSGIMGLTGEGGRPPVRCAGSPIDIATSYLAWGAIMTGLYVLRTTGKGTLLEVSLMESALGFMHAYLQSALAGHAIPGRLGSETMGIYPVGPFTAKGDDYLFVQVSNERQWKRLCQLLGAPALADDARFSDNPSRVRNRDALRPLLQARLSERPASEWEQALMQAGVPASHVRSIADVAADPQVIARNMVKPTALPSGRTVPTWGVPVKMDEQIEGPLLGVPSLDQHRGEVLAELAELEAQRTD